MTAPVLAGVVLVVMLAAAVTTVAGFGFSLMAVPLLAALVGPREAVAMASLLALVSSAALLGRLRHRVNRPVAGRQLAAARGRHALRLGAAPAGGRAGPTDRHRRRGGPGHRGPVAGSALERGGPLVDVAAGFLSGLLNTSVGTSGPPLVFVNQARRLEPDAFRATLSAVFTGSALVGGALFAFAGRYTPAVLAATGLGLPAVGAGCLVGLRLHHHVDAARMRPLVLGLLFASAAVAAASALA